jgi:uncharacterized protein (TIGR02231 family)
MLVRTDKNNNLINRYSNVSAKDLTTTFELKTKNSIPSDNSAHKVTIASTIQPIEFEHTSIPKVVEKVYLKGKVINKNDYPFLEGEINVFIENDFINRTYLKTIVPNDTLELALGIDESIQIKKVLKNKYYESHGLISKTHRITYEQEIEVINNRNTEETILMYDQIPIPMNEKIEVQRLVPDPEQKKINNNKELSWKLKLGPGEKKVIPIKFYIEYPDDIRVYGLE